MPGTPSKLNFAILQGMGDYVIFNARQASVSLARYLEVKKSTRKLYDGSE